ncbi:hypothetical protein FRC08_013526 [Ceratobasidium sp. 394]|nr:hypothetical protein FRC08_013526 [Ceratobasidium sp. 394]
MATVELGSCDFPRTHSEDDTPESSPLVSPDAPVFPISESDPKSTKQDIEFVAPHVLLPSAPIGGPGRQPETHKDSCAELYSNPAWQSYRNAREARRSKPWTPTRSGSKANSFPTPSHPMSPASLRLDTATANGTMSVSSPGNSRLATGAVGHWRPTPMPATSRSRSPTRLEPQPSPMAKTPSGCTPTKSGSVKALLISGRGQNWSPFRRRNDNLFVAIQKAVDKVEKFEGMNYPSWSYWFQRKVAGVPGHNIWGHISGLRPRPTEPSVTWDQEAGYGMDPIERWDMDEAAIYCALLSVISSTVARGQVEGCTTAKQVWDRLELLYGDPDAPATKAASIIRELSQVTYTPGDDLKTHLRGMQSLVNQLQEGPYRIPESLALWFIYDSMPGYFAAEVRDLRKEDLPLNLAIEKLKEIGDKVLGDQSKAQGIKYRQTVTRAGALPLDLRHYKYRGNGEASDGQLYKRAQNTCLACLGTGHKAYSEECPQTEVRFGLWGKQGDPSMAESSPDSAHTIVDQRHALGLGLPSERFTSVQMARTISTGPKLAAESPNWREV